MAVTTLPNASTLSKVYPGWQKLVHDGSISRFITAKVTGSLTTEIFGVSSRFGSAVVATPGLQDLILASPYPNFATSMALSSEHYVEANKDGCFGTIRRADLQRASNPMKQIVAMNIDGYSGFETTPLLKSDGWVHHGYWSNGSFEPLAADKQETWDTIRNESYAKFVLSAPVDSAAHSRVVGTMNPTLSKLGFDVDNSLPLLCVGDNYNFQAAGNSGMEIPGSYSAADRATICNAASGLDLPGRKIVWIFVINSATTGYYGSYTWAYGIYVKDDGRLDVPCFMRNREQKTNAVYWNGIDGRYQTAIERTGTQHSSSHPSILRVLFGDTIKIDGYSYATAVINDGWAKSGPMISDRVNGTDKVRRINFTPLLGIPGSLEYSFVGDVTLIGDKVYLVDDVEVTVSEYSVDSSIFVASLDFNWYELYYKTGFDVYTPRNSNIQANTLESWSAIRDYQVTIAQTKASYTLTEQMIQALPAYKAYAKMRKKACKDNNFMDQSFDGVKTYKQVLAAAKPRSAFMQLLSDSAIREFSVSYQTLASVSMVNGVATGIQLDGTAVLVDVDVYCQYLMAGGARVTPVETALGIDAVTINAITAEKKDVPNVNLNPYAFGGDGSEDFTTNRFTQTVNGYPLYTALNPTQRTYLHLTNIAQYDAMVSPLIRVIQSLSADKMWARFK